MEQQPEDGKEDVVLCGHPKFGCQVGARLANKGRLQKSAVLLQVGREAGRQVGGWVVRYLDKGVAETLADTLDGDLGVAVVVAVIVAHSHLHKKETDAGVRKVAVCSFCPDSSTDQLAVVQRMRRM